MRRLLAGLALGALVFGVAFAGAKVATVTNPMSAPLDGDFNAIYRLSSVTSDAVFLGGYNPDGATWSSYAIRYGFDDPSTGLGVQARPGSLYVRNADGFPGQANSYGTTGELWLKTGPRVTDWRKVALSP